MYDILTSESYILDISDPVQATPECQAMALVGDSDGGLYGARLRDWGRGQHGLPHWRDGGQVQFCAAWTGRSVHIYPGEVIISLKNVLNISTRSFALCLPGYIMSTS